MAFRNGVELVFHHLGIPDHRAATGERYSALSGMYSADADCDTLRIQWHCFESDCTLHPLLRTLPHPAFKTTDLDRAIAGAPLLLGPTNRSSVFAWRSSRMAGCRSS